MRMGKLVIGFDFILLTAGFYLIDSDGVFTMALIAATVHELGHLIAIKLCGAKIMRIYLGAFGAKIEMKLYPIISYKREIIIALAGPLAGAIFGAVLSFAGQYTLAGMSLALTVFNLIPALPLDGGRAVGFTALLLFDEMWQKVISKVLNALSVLLIIVLCFYVSVNFGISPSLILFCTFVSFNFLRELFE